MNALPAVPLTCDSDIRPRRGETSAQGDADILPLRPSRPHDTPASRPRDTPAAGPLRLTRRGRVVVAVAAALLVMVVSLLVAGAAQAANHAPSARAARQNVVRVVVGPGQSLWSVAESADPDQDTRAVVQQIVDLNGLSSDVVYAGQQLWVPRG